MDEYAIIMATNEDGVEGIMTVKEVKDILKDYKNTERIYIAKSIELKRIEKQKDALCDVSAIQLSGMPKSGNIADPTFYKFLEMTIQFDSTIERLKSDILFLNKKMKKIEKNIKLLPTFEYNLIEQKFILGKGWELIAEEQNYNQRYIFKVAQRAIKQLAQSWK